MTMFFKAGVGATLRAGMVSLAALTAGGMAFAEVSQQTYDKSDLVLVTTVINATNPYMASWIEGSKALGEKLGLPVEIVQSNGSSQTQIAGIQALAAKGKKIVLVTNPLAASDVPAIYNTVKQNGGYMVVWWNMPPNMEPSQVGDHFVAFQKHPGVSSGRCGAQAIGEALGRPVPLRRWFEVETLAELAVYDPYYCDGSARRRMTEAGLLNVYNKKEDFYGAIAAGTTPGSCL